MRNVIQTNVERLIAMDTENPHGYVPFPPPAGSGKSHDAYAWMAMQLIMARQADDFQEGSPGLHRFAFFTPRKNNISADAIAEVYKKDNMWKDSFDPEIYEYLKDCVLFLDSKMEVYKEIFIQNQSKNQKLILQMENTEVQAGEDVIRLGDTEVYGDFRKALRDVQRRESNAVFTRADIETAKNTFNDCEKALKRLIRKNYKVRETREHGPEIEALKVESRKMGKKKFVLDEHTRYTWLKKDDQWNWMLQVFPSVSLFEKPVLMMSAHKYYYPIDTVLFGIVDLADHDLLKGQVLFIDEVDSVQKTWMEIMFNEDKNLFIEPIHMFQQIHAIMEDVAYPRDCLSIKMEPAFNALKKKFETVYTECHLGYQYKSNSSNEFKSRYLFYDGEYIAMKEGGNRIKVVPDICNSDQSQRVCRLVFNDQELEDCLKETGVKEEEVVTLSSVLLKVLIKLDEFARFIMRAAQQNAKEKTEDEQNRDPIKSLVQEETSERNSLMDFFHLNADERKYVNASIVHQRRIRKSGKGSKKDDRAENGTYQYDYFDDGIQIFFFQDSNDSRTRTKIMYQRIYQTPEALLGYIAERSIVIGLSATSEIESCLCNFEFGYLKERLGNHFLFLDGQDKERLQEWYLRRNNNYGIGLGQINIQVIPVYPGVEKSQDSTYDDEEVYASWMLVFEHPEVIHAMSQVFGSQTDSYYLGRLIQAGFLFRELLTMSLNLVHSMLCILQQNIIHPKKGLEKMTSVGWSFPKENSESTTMMTWENILILFHLIRLDLKGELLPLVREYAAANKNFRDISFKGSDLVDTAQYLRFLFKNDQYDNKFDAAWENTRKSLETRNPEKLMVFTSSQTAGAGVNLTYAMEAQERSRLVCKHHGEVYTGNKKDFDAVYLTKATHVLARPELKRLPWTIDDVGPLIIQVERLAYCQQIDWRWKKVLIEDCLQGMISHQEQYKLVLDMTQYGDKFPRANLYNCQAVGNAVCQQAIQNVGRIDRTDYKRPLLRIYAEAELLDLVPSEDVKKIHVSPVAKKVLDEMGNYSKKIADIRVKNGFSIVNQLNAAYPQNTLQETSEVQSPGREAEEVIVNGAIEKSNAFHAAMKDTLSILFDGAENKSRNSEIKNWKQMREVVLTHGYSMSYAQYRKLIRGGGKAKMLFSNMYVNSPEGVDSYWYQWTGNPNDKVRNVWFHKTDETGTSRVSEGRLKEMFRVVPGLEDHFRKRGYSVDFQPGDYILNPVAYRNIYLGAIGEEACKYMLSDKLGYPVEELPDNVIERMDFKLAGHSIAVDAKNFGPYRQPYVDHESENKSEMRRYAKKTLQAGAEKGIIINIYKPDNTSKPSVVTEIVKDADGREQPVKLLRIPSLMTETGEVNKDAESLIAEFVPRLG